MEIDELLRDGLLTVEDIIHDIRLEEEWLKNRCPRCGFGNVDGKCCELCAWEYESDERTQKSNHTSSSPGCSKYDEILREYGIDINRYIKKNDKKSFAAQYQEHLREHRVPIKTGSSIPCDTRVMNAGLQKHNLERKLKKEFGDSAEHLDPKSLIDPECHYDENLRMILPDLGIGKKVTEEQFKERYQKEYGQEEYDTMLREQKKAEDRSKYSSICTLANASWQDFKAAGKLTSVRITNVFEKPTVNLLMNFMLSRFKESGYRDWLICQFGHYCVERCFEDYDLFLGLKLVGCTQNHFKDPRREYAQPFDLRANLPRGNDDIILFYSKKQQGALEEFLKQFKEIYNVKIKKADVAYLYLINSFESFFRDVKYIKIPTDADPDKKLLVNDFENSHYYISSNGLVLNVQNQLAVYREQFITHFKSILPTLENEFEVKKHEPGVTPGNLEYKRRTIEAIRKYINSIEF